MEKGTDEITLDGKRYISVKRAAILAEYTTDYVGQLCRGNKIDATRIGRNWYVHENSLIEHKQSQLELREEGDQKEIQRKIIRKGSIFKNSFVIYSKDERSLFPELIDKTPKITHIPIKDEKDDVIQVPSSIFTKTSTKLEEAAKNTANLFSVSRTALVFGSAFVVFMALFSINTPYTFNLLDKGAENLTSAVLSTEFGETVNEEIFSPFKLVAKEINTRVDETIYSLLYKDILYSE